MQDVNRIVDVDHVQRPVGIALIPNANLPHTTTDAWHRLPVLGIEPTLHAVYLSTHVLTDGLRKGPEVIEGRSDEPHLPHAREGLKLETSCQAENVSAERLRFSR